MKFKSVVLNQVWASAASGLILSGLISVWGFPATALPQLTLSSEPLLTHSQAAWFTSVPMLTCVPGSVFGGALAERVGPRRLQLALSPVLMVAFVGMPTAEWLRPFGESASYAILILCRVVQGLIVALLYPAVHMYPCEIADPRRRGTLGSLLQVWASLGYLLCYLLGRYLSWNTLAVALPIVTLLPGCLGLILSHESPLWLARRGNTQQAQQVMTYLRKSPEDAARDLTAAMEVARNKTRWQTVLRSPDRKVYLVSVAVSVAVFVMTQLTGQIIISANAVHIFQSAGVGLSPSLSSIVVGTTRLVFCALGSLLLYRVPRKTLLVAGNAVAGIALVSVATFFFLQSRHYDVSGLTWLPLGSLMLYMVAFATGIGPASSLIHVEVLPGPVRSVGCSVAATCFFATIYLVTKTFDDLEAALGLYSVFGAYSIACVAFILLVVLFVPETKDRSLGEIESFWKNKYGEKTLPANQELLPEQL